MNIIDIILGLILIFAIYNGGREGVIMQLSTFIGIVLAIFLGRTFALTVGQDILHIAPEYAYMGGFIIIFFAAILAVAVAARLLSKVLSFVGLGFINRFLGVVLSLITTSVILSFACVLFMWINGEGTIVDAATLKSSHLFYPIMSISEHVAPAFNAAKHSLETII